MTKEVSDNKKCRMSSPLPHQKTELVSLLLGSGCADPCVLIKWASMAERGMAGFLNTHRSTFHRRCCRGVPQCYRWDAWSSLIHHSVPSSTSSCSGCSPPISKDSASGGGSKGDEFSIYEKQAGLHSTSSVWTCSPYLLLSSFGGPSKLLTSTYWQFSHANGKYSALIQIDIPRTFPELQFFDSSGQLQLYRILNGYANACPDVGYCQGMNFVAGLLLLVSGFREEAAYRMMVRLMDGYGLRGFYQDEFPLLNVYIALFDCLCHQQLPEVAEHFRREGVCPAMYLHQWFLTLFVTALPLGTVVVLWDYVLVHGLRALLPLSVSLLKVVQKVLLHLNFEEIVKFVRAMKYSSHQRNNHSTIGKGESGQRQRSVEGVSVGGGGDKTIDHSSSIVSGSTRSGRSGSYVQMDDICAHSVDDSYPSSSPSVCSTPGGGRRLPRSPSFPTKPTRACTMACRDACQDDYRIGRLLVKQAQQISLPENITRVLDALQTDCSQAGCEEALNKFTATFATSATAGSANLGLPADCKDLGPPEDEASITNTIRSHGGGSIGKNDDSSNNDNTISSSVLCSPSSLSSSTSLFSSLSSGLQSSSSPVSSSPASLPAMLRALLFVSPVPCRTPPTELTPVSAFRTGDEKQEEEEKSRRRKKGETNLGGEETGAKEKKGGEEEGEEEEWAEELEDGQKKKTKRK